MTEDIWGDITLSNMDYSDEDYEEYPPEIYTIEEFRDAVRGGLFNSDDGAGYYTNVGQPHSPIYVNLKELAQGQQEPGFTHIEWFNK